MRQGNYNILSNLSIYLEMSSDVLQHRASQHQKICGKGTEQKLPSSGKFSVGCVLTRAADRPAAQWYRAPAEGYYMYLLGQRQEIVSSKEYIENKEQIVWWKSAARQTHQKMTACSRSVTYLLRNSSFHSAGNRESRRDSVGLHSA